MNALEWPLSGRVVTSTPDGVEIAVQEWGDRAGRPIIFVHGFSQCHLSWSRQYAGGRDAGGLDTYGLARDFRLITYDLRGHGQSGKPMSPHYYRESDRWADELACVIERVRPLKPVLVAWSYGGRVVIDYLAKFGGAALAGIVLVGSKISSGAEFSCAGIPALQMATAAGDLTVSISATISFLKSCAESWDVDEFGRQLAFNMLVPAEVRGFLLGRQFNADAIFKDLDLPVLFVHGKQDRVTPYAASLHGHAMAARSRLSLYDGVGHCPFFEAPDRFNDELAEFVRRDCAG